jgi:ribonuclease HI
LKIRDTLPKIQSELHSTYYNIISQFGKQGGTTSPQSPIANEIKSTMGLPSAVQVRVKSLRGVEGTEAEAGGAIVSSWSMPIYGVVMRSYSIMSAFGEDWVLMQSRIAEALGIHSGDIVEFELVGVGDTFRLPIKINDKMKCDVLIHDWTTLGIAARIEMDSRKYEGEKVTLASGKTFFTTTQEMWAGMKAVEHKGTAVLHFDGASRGNPKGQGGYAFRITVGEDSNNETGLISSLVQPFSHGTELIRGYGYGGGDRTTTEMEYTGLLEGLIWALRLDSKHIKVCGDSRLVLGQVFEQFPVEDGELSILQAKVAALLDGKPSETIVTYSHVTREDNRMAELFANMGIDARENVTVCNWDNVNNFMWLDANNGGNPFRNRGV